MASPSRRGTHRTPANGLLGDSRVRLLDELCGHPQTAAELAQRVGTSANAVRVHLDALRDAGLVDFEVERRGVGKPRHVYSITSAAEYLLSAAYAPTLDALLGVVIERSGEELAAVLGAAGAALGDRLAVAKADRPVTTAARALRALGRPVSVSQIDDEWLLSTRCCPLADVTRRTERACQLVEAMLGSVSDLPVREQCSRGDHPACRFSIPKAGEQSVGVGPSHSR